MATPFVLAKSDGLARDDGRLASDTRDLVARASLGDTEAFRKIYECYRADVARLAFRMAGRRFDIDDLVQEVFVQVYRSLPEFRGESKFRTWLHRLTVNVVLMARRSAGSRPCLTQALPSKRERIRVRAARMRMPRGTSACARSNECSIV